MGLLAQLRRQCDRAMSRQPQVPWPVSPIGVLVRTSKDPVLHGTLLACGHESVCGLTKLPASSLSTI